MGLISAAVNSVSGVFNDQWKDFFYCESMPADILVAKGRKRGAKNNTSNVITDGSAVAVNEGQCMIIVEQGAILELCAEPGEYIYNTGTASSIFTGNSNLAENIQAVIDQIGERFTFGGIAGKDQRIYYFNTKEIVGNKYGTPSPIPFRVVDRNVGLDIDISVRCFGEYSYRLTNPVLFYTNVCGNIETEYTRDEIDSQLKSELITALQPAFAKISEMGIRYSALPGHTQELSNILNEVLSKKWKDLRGIEIISFGINSIKASEEDEAMIKELQRNAAFRNPSMAAAHLVSAQAEAMQSAAANDAGAAVGFMGMNMANKAGNLNANDLFAMASQQTAQQPANNANQWTCNCGNVNTGKFCQNCGQAKPQPQATVNSWKCSCGESNTGKFCVNCGKPKPANNTWICSCGATNSGKFCMECGSAKPETKPVYQCDKCGWKPADPTNPPKFCPNCGDRFDENDKA